MMMMMMKKKVSNYRFDQSAPILNSNYLVYFKFKKIIIISEYRVDLTAYILFLTQLLN